MFEFVHYVAIETCGLIATTKTALLTAKLLAFSMNYQWSSRFVLTQSINHTHKSMLQLLERPQKGGEVEKEKISSFLASKAFVIQLG